MTSYRPLEFLRRNRVRPLQAWFWPLLLSGLFVGALPALAADGMTTDDDAPAVPVTAVLTTAEFDVPLPAFHDADRAGVTFADLLDQLPAVPGPTHPCPGCGFPGPGGEDLTWHEVERDDGRYSLNVPTEGSSAAYLAFYIASDRWQTATLQIETSGEVRAWFAGSDLALQKNDDDAQTAELTLPIGKHLVVVRTGFCSASGETAAEATARPTWSVALSLQTAADTQAGSLSSTTTPERPADIDVILNAPRFTSADLSPDGELVVLGLGEYRDGEHRETWLEIRDTDDGDLVHIWRGDDSPSGATWCPVGRRLSWRVDTEKKASLRYFDLDDHSTGVLLADVEHLGRWAWAPDGKSIVYEITRSPETDERKVKHVLHPADRQPWWRDRSHLMQVFVPSGLTRRLTAGPVSASDWQISPDSRRLLFVTEEPDLGTRPYTATTLWLLDLETLAVEQILADPWIGGAVFGPDPQVLCLRGSPSAFDGLGRNLPDGVQANDYGGQLFLFDLETRRPTAITRDLRPDVGHVQWSPSDGHIYAQTTDTQYSNVYRYDVDDERWEKVDTGLEYTDQFIAPSDGHTAVARGTSATVPNRLYAVDLKKNRSRLLYDPGEAAYRDVVFGRVEDWVCTLPNGESLDGRIYYPPRFDAQASYPLIVYYYGGTSPVTRDFGGRYPKNVWAGQDYVVYVPEPSGATGYGQEFAARHVNDWGKLTADEVIDATKSFLDTFDFVDPERVGCIGASYGGFLTEYIITRTDIFAAAVSHAGISSISSYWGEGLWGYAYGARALAGSFPWQDRDLYVDQSPLFFADQITTPLLLVHGDSDVNVPVGESDQLFTALKMLDREVEYVQIQGQDHHILDHDQRIVWNDTILAFFAKYLKDRPAWWEALYPEPKDYR